VPAPRRLAQVITATGGCHDLEVGHASACRRAEAGGSPAFAGESQAPQGKSSGFGLCRFHHLVVDNGKSGDLGAERVDLWPLEIAAAAGKNRRRNGGVTRRDALLALLADLHRLDCSVSPPMRDAEAGALCVAGNRACRRPFRPPTDHSRRSQVSLRLRVRRHPAAKPVKFVAYRKRRPASRIWHARRPRRRYTNKDTFEGG
jgi:hypothetical protein